MFWNEVAFCSSWSSLLIIEQGYQLQQALTSTAVFVTSIEVLVVVGLHNWDYTFTVFW